MPLTGMTLDQVLWELPAAIARQLQLIYLQMQGCQFVASPQSKERIFERLKARTHRG